MDNLTHTIVGLAVGELIHRSVAAEPDPEPDATPAAQRTRHRLLLSACALASNFPDLDLVLGRLLPAPLGYLLHHRGHTHTLLLEIPQALLLLALLWLLWPNARQLLRTSASARLGLALAIVSGFLLHIGMDYLNSYGVHPFYPFDMGWRYGDMVFIIEPLFWVSTGVPLLLALPRRGWRWACGLLLGSVLVTCATLGFLHWASLVLLASVALLVAWGAARDRPHAERGRAALLTGLALCVAFVGVQAAASQRARSLLQDEAALRAPTYRLLDAALTGYPANPLCWNFAAIEMDPTAGRYHVRRGVLSLAPAALPVAACPTGLTGDVRTSAGSAIGLLSDDSADLGQLRRGAASDCNLAAWLRFARIPLFDGETASDLRFGTALAPNFSTIDLTRVKQRGCPAPLPPWSMPRADMLAR